jgi:NTP pyrophosphatase (non-canonical NTP hydrolase)
VSIQPLLEFFLGNLERQAYRKEKLYDGTSRDLSVDVALRFVVEELGEVSQEITRDRYQSALDECVDLAHTVFLLYQAISKLKEEGVIHTRSENAKE